MSRNCVQKLWRINYYGARRAGGEQENVRRAQDHRESPPPAQQSSPYEEGASGWGADTGQADSWQADRPAASVDPRNARRRSVDYASRRGGSDPENQRRRRSSSAAQRRVSRSSPSQNGAQPSSYTSDSSYTSSLPPPSGPKIDPRVQRRQSVDYAARRSGSGRARSTPSNRSTSGPVSTRQVPSEPASSPRDFSTRQTPRAMPRESVDYSARHARVDPENARRHIAASPASSTSTPAPSVIRRKSGDYAARRSGGQEENLRRRSEEFSIPPGSGTPPQVPVTASEALERVRELAARRRITPDYAARRSSLSPDLTNGRRRSVSTPPVVPPVAPPVAPPASSNGANHSSYGHGNGTAKRAEERAAKPYIARKSVPSYASRRSEDFQGRPGHPGRRRSMARFTLAEVKSALANRKRSTGSQRSASAGNSRNGNGARPSALDESVDYGAHAMQSVEQLMGAYSDLAGVPVHSLKVDSSSDYRFPYNHDPAEGALKSLEKVADLIARASPAAGSRW